MLQLTSSDFSHCFFILNKQKTASIGQRFLWV
nr:MAG TPA: hypothetical protein [Caudoviricetes sp.]